MCCFGLDLFDWFKVVGCCVLLVVWLFWFCYFGCWLVFVSGLGWFRLVVILLHGNHFLRYYTVLVVCLLGVRCLVFVSLLCCGWLRFDVWCVGMVDVFGFVCGFYGFVGCYRFVGDFVLFVVGW